jgi:hypothetical protein
LYPWHQVADDADDGGGGQGEAFHPVDDRLAHLPTVKVETKSFFFVANIEAK